jgi:hypothetical protein
MEDEIQTFGRAARSDQMDGLCLTMVGPWVYDLNLGDRDEEFDGGQDCEIDPWVTDIFRDPDKPVVSAANKKRSTKQNHMGYASVACCQSNICIRRFYAGYLGDTSLDGNTSIDSKPLFAYLCICSSQFHCNLVL